ncbi:transporter [Pontibacillus halophilus JSM 076056 = DSM 19796]|uniref:Transporter n=1 Tax=Pontibacillus halophilus JSM 076056 = DSM 19796 TaxID=1385510 RepID=A0A0A5GFU6_9BACI|nr:AEC family transporter [Pontibacillus halophilus]KGX90889.1 transporter [Pontibacillus halophilus JSM 076056 = DSM 19796]
MDVFFEIVLNVNLPVFSLIAIGVYLHRKFSFDLATLAKLNTYLLMPAVSFANIYESKLSADLIMTVMGFLVIQNLLLMGVSSGISKAFKFERGLSSTFKNSVVLSNSGNFGLPVSQLVFQHNPLGMSIQIIVMIFQNLLTYTYGLFNSVSSERKGFQALLLFAKNPVLYAFLAGMFLQVTSITIPEFIWSPIENTSNAFLAIALITLGAQSAFLKFNKLCTPLVLSVLGRLVLSPCIAFIIILLINLEGTIAQALFIASSFPTSRNSALFALEYDNHPEFAAQAVLLTTGCSMVTVTTIVYVSELLFV